jgi:hypothetical protein
MWVQASGTSGRRTEKEDDMRHITENIGIILLAVILATLGCQRQTELEPVAEEGMDVAVEDDVAETTLAGFEMTVDGDAWQGETEVGEAVTPLKVEITNASAVPLSLEYANFVLVGASGQYEALPVFPYSVVHGEPELEPGFEAPADQELVAVGFHVAPYYAPIFPDLAVAPALLLDRDYYGRYLTIWDESGLPTDEMQRLALPEGILLPEGSVSGFIYFERVPDAEKKVNLLVQLENAETNELEGTLRVPMEPEPILEP